MGVEDEASRCAMEAADDIKEGGTEARSVPNGCVYPGEDAVLFRLTVDAPGRGEPCGCIYKYARRQ